jgi:hypothetical protein
LLERNADGEYGGARSDLTIDEVRQAMATIVEIKSRMKLSDTNNVDLIAYTDGASLQAERDDLAMATALGEIMMTNMLEAHPEMATELGFETADEAITTATEARHGQLLGEVGEKDAIFRQQRRRAVRNRMIVAGATGVIVGTVFQEARAMFDDNQVGLLESGGTSGEHHTALGGLRDILRGNVDAVGGGPGDPIDLDPTHALKGGGGGEWHQNSDGSLSIMHGDRELVGGLHAQNGLLDDASRAKIDAAGIVVGTENYTVPTVSTETITSGTDEFLANHADKVQRISRVWMDNDTSAPRYDLNELRLDLHMGPDGHYQYDMNRMFEDGSFHGGTAENARQLIAGDQAKMLFSLDRSHQAAPLVLEMSQSWQRCMRRLATRLVALATKFNTIFWQPILAGG